MKNSLEQISSEPAAKPKVILFDVYETLLDMSDVKAKVNRLLNNKRGFVIWFNTVLQYSWLDNSTGLYHDFTTLAKLAMDTVGKMLGGRIDAESKDDVLQLMRQLPVHEDVQEGLSLLRDSNYRLATLTNASEAAISERMQRTGLVSYFDAILSTEKVKRHKPATEAYLWAAQALNVKPNELLMVSAHGWDIAGAIQAGLQTAFIQRGEQSLYPLAPEPIIKIKDLAKLTFQLA